MATYVIVPFVVGRETICDLERTQSHPRLGSPNAVCWTAARRTVRDLPGGTFRIQDPGLCGARLPRKTELLSLLSILDYNRSDNSELGQWAYAVPAQGSRTGRHRSSHLPGSANVVGPRALSRSSNRCRLRKESSPAQK